MLFKIFCFKFMSRYQKKNNRIVRHKKMKTMPNQYGIEIKL